MKLKEIEKQFNKVSKKYGMPNVIASRGNGHSDGVSGYDGVEVRSELSMEEADEAIQVIEKNNPSYIVESCGGCVYFVYEV